MPLGFRFGRPFSPFSRIFSSVSAATLASSCATAAKRLTTRDRSSAAERSSRLGNSERIIMPPSPHNSRRSGPPLSQFAAPVSPAPVPQVFENSRQPDLGHPVRLSQAGDPRLPGGGRNLLRRGQGQGGARAVA